jgi:cell division protein FtsL
MKAIDLLATSLNKRDEKANQALALEIIKGSRYEWIKEIADNLNNKDKNIQSEFFTKSGKTVLLK